MIILMGKDSTDLEMIQQETTGSRGSLKRSSQAIMSKPSFFLKSIAEHANMRKGRSENTVDVQIIIFPSNWFWNVLAFNNFQIFRNDYKFKSTYHTH